MAVPAQIVRRCNNRGAGVLADANRDHVPLDPMAGADAGVEAIANDVGQAAVGDDLDANGGIGGQELRENGFDHRFRGRARNGETKLAAGLVAEHVDGFHRGFKTVERRPQLRQEPLADFRQRDAAGGSIEQPHAELLLETADGFAERRTRDAELDCRLSEARTLGGRHEGVHLGKTQLPHCSESPTISYG